MTANRSSAAAASAHDDLDHENQPSPRLIRRTAPPPRKFRLWRWLAFGLLGLAGLVALAPTLISKTAVGDWLLAQVVPTAFGRLEIAQRDLGWWSPISVGKVRLHCSQGNLMAEVESIRTKETLWEILTTGQLSEVWVDQAAVQVDWRLDGSNWEDWVAAVLPVVQPDEPVQDSTTPDLAVHFDNCQILLESRSDQQRWLMEQIGGQLLVQRNARKVVLETKLALKDADQNLAAGSCELNLCFADQASLTEMRELWQLTIADEQAFKINTTTGGLAFQVKLDRLAASLGRSVLRRFLPTLELSGLATGQIVGLTNWYGDYVQVMTPKVSLDRLVVSDSTHLPGDQLRLQQLEAGGAVTLSPGQLHCRQVQVVADYVRSDIDGSVAFDEMYQALTTRRLPTTTLTTQGTINLAQLANQLPNTLKLQEGLQLDSGDLTWQLFNRPEGDGSQRLFVDVTAKNLSGRRQGQRVQWATPIQFSSSLRDYNRPVSFDHVDLQSDFVTAAARPLADGGTQLDFAVDFDRLRQALDQFFQLPPVVLQGRADGQANWRMLTHDGRPASLSEPATGMEVRGVAHLVDAHVAIPQVFEVREPNMTLDAQTSLQWGNPQLETQGLLALLAAEADVTIRSGRVELKTVRPVVAGAMPVVADPSGLNPSALGLLVDLKQPVHLPRLHQIWQYVTGAARPPANPAQAPVLVAEVGVTGPLEQWLALVRPLLAGVDIAMTGATQTKFDLTLNDRFALFNNLQGSSQQFGFRGNGVILQEPMVQVAGAASYHYASGLIHTEDFQILGKSLSVRATKTRLQFAPLNNRMEGEVYLHGDIARLWHTYQLMQLAAEENEPNRLGQRTLDFTELPQLAVQPLFDQIQLVGHTEAPTGNTSSPVGFPAVGATPTASSSSAPLGMGGELIAKVTLKSENLGPIDIDIQSEVKNAWVGNQQPTGAWVAWLKEPRILANAQAKISPDLSRLDLPNAYVESPRLRAVTAGTITDLTQQPQLDLRGQVETSAMAWLEQFAGPDAVAVQVNGLTNHRFELLGPPAIAQLQGRWISSWQAIQWMGLQSGPADIVIQLNQGIARLVPLRFAAGGGQIHLAPEVDLRQEPIWVRLPRGVIFDQVKLTPEICRNFLKYSAPLLAEVTSVQGSFSLDSDGIEVPLSDWTKLVAKARVTINGARVGPGPLGIQIGNIASTVRAVADGQSLDAAGMQALGLGGLADLTRSGDGQRTQALTDLASNLLGSLNSGQRPDLGTLVAGQPQDAGATGGEPSNAVSEQNWLEIPVQTIAVNLQEGGVTHEQLKMNIRGFELVSSGRVGLDQSVALQTHLNVPDEVLLKNPQVAAALGNRIDLPISGTLTQPSIQSGQLRTALNSALGQGVQNMLGSELERRLGGGNAAGGNSSGADPIQGLLEQGQRRLEEKINERLNLPPGGFNPGSLLPGGLLPGAPRPSGTGPTGNSLPGLGPTGSLPLSPASPDATAPTTATGGTMSAGTAPSATPPLAPTSGSALPALPTAAEAEDSINRFLNRSLERGRQRLLGGDK